MAAVTARMRSCAEPLLDEFLGVGIDEHVLAQLLQPGQPLEQVVHVLDRPVRQRRDDLAGRARPAFAAAAAAERHLADIMQVQGQLRWHIGPPKLIAE